MLEYKYTTVVGYTMARTTFIIVATLGVALAAQCDQSGSGYTYSETISGTTRTVVISGCPNHYYTTGLNPNYAASGTDTLNIPATPKLLAAGTTYSLAAQGGSVGTFFNGAQLVKRAD